MPQYGVLVYAPAPADPMDLTPEQLESLARYPEQAKDLGGKVLGGSYFPEQRGFAFETSASAASVLGEEVRTGPLVESALVPAAFFVLSAPSLEVAVRIASHHPVTRSGGGVEVRPLFAPPAE